MLLSNPKKLIKWSSILFSIPLCGWLGATGYIKYEINQYIETRLGSSILFQPLNLKVKSMNTSFFTTYLTTEISIDNATEPFELSHHIQHGPITWSGFKPKILIGSIETSLNSWPFKEQPQQAVPFIMTASTTIPFQRDSETNISIKPFTMILDNQKKTSLDFKGLSAQLVHEEAQLKQTLSNLKFSFDKRIEGEDLPSITSQNIYGQADLYAHADGTWHTNLTLNTKEYYDSTKGRIKEGKLNIDADLKSPLSINAVFDGQVEFENIVTQMHFDGNINIKSEPNSWVINHLTLPINRLTIAYKPNYFSYSGTLDMPIYHQGTLAQRLSMFNEAKGDFNASFNQELLPSLFWILLPIQAAAEGNYGLEQQQALRKNLQEKSQSASDTFINSSYYQKNDDGLMAVEGSFKNGRIQLQSYE